MISSNFKIQYKDLPKLYFDRTKLYQVFQNIISNAVKYMNKPNGEVLITCQEMDDHWVFSIQDNGPGIDPQNYEKVFQMFKTLDPTNNPDSTGIGMPIVKKIIESTGGKIWIEPNPTGGTIFKFTILKVR